MPSNHCAVASSPSLMRIAVTKSWNDAFDGATPMRPFHSGSTRSSTVSGSSDSSVIVRVVDQHPLASGEPDPTAVAGVEAFGDEVEHVVRKRAEQTLLIEVPDRAGRLRQEHVGGRLVALLVDEQGQVGGVAVAHLDVDAGLLREPVEDRLDQVLRPARVDRHRVTTAGSVVGAAAGDHSRADQEGQREDPNRCAHEVKVPSPRRKVHRTSWTA